MLKRLLIVFAVVVVGACESAPQGPGPVAADPTVELRDSRFHPNTLTVETGTTVAWVWNDVIPHNVVGEGFESETVDNGTFSHTFDQPGRYDYECTLHGGMKGTVFVVEA